MRMRRHSAGNDDEAGIDLSPMVAQGKQEHLRYLEILTPNTMVGLQVFSHKHVLDM